MYKLEKIRVTTNSLWSNDERFLHHMGRRALVSCLWFYFNCIEILANKLCLSRSNHVVNSKPIEVLQKYFS